MEYTAQVSSDGETWEQLYTQDKGQGGIEVWEDLHSRGRYLELIFTKAGPSQLYSIWELEFLNPEASEALHSQVQRVQEHERRVMEMQQVELRSKLEKEGVEEIIFVTREIYEDIHWYANISYYAADEEDELYVKGAGLYKLHVQTGKVTPLIEDAEGTLRDPAVHYDGETILFSWREGDEKNFHLYTIRSDGTGLTQLTSGAYDDIEPAWLPDGGIVFVSSRSRRWVNCWFTKVATLHRCDSDGGNILPLSANLEHDNTPWPLPDGRVLYTRWEYIDRSQVDYHHLWTMNPDGSNQTVYYGNMHPGGLYIDAKPIPGTDETLIINSPLHGKREHAGYLAIATAKNGPDDPSSLRTLAKGLYRDPFAINKDLFMAAHQDTLVFVDREGEVQCFHQLSESERPRKLHEPRPLIPRSRERGIPPRTDYSMPMGRLVLANAHTGRNMGGVEVGDIKRLLVVESLPKPISFSGGMEPITYGGSFTLERILGSVPVEDDGSAYMELPSNRSLFLISQDAQNNSVKRMQSFLTVMPGETTSCLGCHEQRTLAPSSYSSSGLEATKRPPSVIEPIPDIPEVFDFPRDIQPILDKHCVKCHDYTSHENGAFGPREGGVILVGDHGPVFSHSYVSLIAHGQIADGRNLDLSNRAPGTIGASASPFFQLVLEGHQGVEITTHEIEMLRYWIETGAPYAGTYGALGSGAIGGSYQLEGLNPDTGWPASIAASKVIEEHCNTCHTGIEKLPRTLSERVTVTPNASKDDPRPFRNRDLLFNLSRPGNSLALLAPLAECSGGYGKCTQEDGRAVIADTSSPLYRAILEMCQAGKDRLESVKRFDMAGFRPPDGYVREMKRYGILPDDLPEDAAVDPYATDRRYWQSFDQTVILNHKAYKTGPIH